MKLSRLASIAAALACVMAVSACANTVRGVGKDVKQTANAVEDAVE
jgi:predicted small secreted protein